MSNDDESDPPSNVLKIDDQEDADPYYFILGCNEKHGRIPGFFNGSEAVYAYGGKKFTAENFDWIVVDEPGMFNSVYLCSFPKSLYIGNCVLKL